MADETTKKAQTNLHEGDAVEANKPADTSNHPVAVKAREEAAAKKD
jgi:hypothetical protein